MLNLVNWNHMCRVGCCGFLCTEGLIILLLVCFSLKLLDFIMMDACNNLVSKHIEQKE